MSTTTTIPVKVNRVSSVLDKLNSGILGNSAMSPSVPISLSLTDGGIEADGKKFQLPIGLQRRLSGLDIKTLLGKYKGLLLFLKSGNSWQRLGDKDVIELSDDSTLKTERPVVRTAPRYNAD